MKKNLYLILLLGLGSNTCFGQSTNSNDVLSLLYDSISNQYGYRDQNGDTIIKMGTYPICFTEKFTKYAIVFKPRKGFIAINKKGKTLFSVMQNGDKPDNPSNGMFRIIKNNKIGYADTNGCVIIKPKFIYGYPFKNNRAKVLFHFRRTHVPGLKLPARDRWVVINEKGIMVMANKDPKARAINIK